MSAIEEFKEVLEGYIDFLNREGEHCRIDDLLLMIENIEEDLKMSLVGRYD